VSVRVQTASLSAEVGGYVNSIDNFIFPNPTGEVDPESGFQIFDITQGDARLAGLEAAAEYHPVGPLHLRFTADYTHGQNTSTDTPLPFIPPFRITYTAKLEGEPVAFVRHAYVSLGGESNARQTRLDPEDFSPDGYTLVHLGAGAMLPAKRSTFAVDFQVRNLFNRRYASFLSRYKRYALDPGRNVVIQVSTEF
jgi:iron complex outermembrane receptor protein